MVCGGCGAVVGMVCGALGLWWVGASGSRKLVSDAGVAPPPKSITKFKKKLWIWLIHTYPLFGSLKLSLNKNYLSLFYNGKVQIFTNFRPCCLSREPLPFFTSPLFEQQQHTN